MDLPSLKHFRFWTVPLGDLRAGIAGSGLDDAALVGLPMIALEFMAGSWRALITFLLSDWLTAPLTVLVCGGALRLRRTPSRAGF